MKCTVTIEEGEVRRKVVRRRFIPLRITVEGLGQYVEKEVKLPFTVNRIVGLLSVVRADRPCREESPPPRLYYGTAASLADARQFFTLSEGESYAGFYPPSASIPYGQSGYWYYAHPDIGLNPYALADGIPEFLVDPERIEVLIPGYCNPVTYTLWFGAYRGGMQIMHSELS